MKNFRIYYKVPGVKTVLTVDMEETSAEAAKETFDDKLCTWFTGFTVVKVEEIQDAAE